MRHAFVALQIVVASLVLNGCALFGDKKEKELTPAQLEQARQYMAANPNGPGAPIAVSRADAGVIARMRDTPSVKELLKSNPKYRDYVKKIAKQAEPEAPPRDAPRGREQAVTQRYLGNGAR